MQGSMNKNLKLHGCNIMQVILWCIIHYGIFMLWFGLTNIQGVTSWNFTKDTLCMEILKVHVVAPRPWIGELNSCCPNPNRNFSLVFSLWPLCEPSCPFGRRLVCYQALAVPLAFPALYWLLHCTGLRDLRVKRLTACLHETYVAIPSSEQS